MRMLKNKNYVAVVDDDESFARALGRLLRFLCVLLFNS